MLIFVFLNFSMIQQKKINFELIKEDLLMKKFLIFFKEFKIIGQTEFKFSIFIRFSVSDCSFRKIIFSKVILGQFIINENIKNKGILDI